MMRWPSELFKLGWKPLRAVSCALRMKELHRTVPMPALRIAALPLACLLAAAGPSRAEDRWTPDLTYGQLAEKARAGSGYFQGLLGMYLLMGEMGLSVNVELARQWSEAAAKNKHPFGVFNLAKLALLNGEFDKAASLYQDAALRLERQASGGDPVALFCMGEIEWMTPPRNGPRALMRLSRSAEAGFPRAQASLGALSIKHKDELPSEEFGVSKGIAYLSAAARSRSATARYNLGLAYFFGEGVPHDAKKAASWFRLAAGQNFLEAQYSLGLMLVEGATDVPKNVPEGARLLKLAAASGHFGAKEDLYKLGLGSRPRGAEGEAPAPAPSIATEDVGALEQAKKLYGEKKYAEAFRRFDALARKKNAEAARYLGVMSLAGRGCEKNVSLARRWLQYAASLGDASAANILEKYAELFR